MREASRLYRALIPIPFPELAGRIDDALASNGFWSAAPGALRRLVPHRRRTRLGAAALVGGALLAIAAAVAVGGREKPEPVVEPAPQPTVTQPVVETIDDTDPPRLILPRRTVTKEATSRTERR